MFAIKAEISDPRARAFAFREQKTMYGGKHIARGDIIFVFASENEGGPGLIASGIIERQRREYPRFWQWRENAVETAMLERKIESVFGWPLHISTSPTTRPLYYFPMQSGGAEMLRPAANRLCEADLVPSMLVHDGILFELDNEEQIQHAIEIMQVAGAEVCSGLEIGVDVDQKLIGGARYRDKRPIAKHMWKVVTDVLREIGALPEAAEL